MNRHPLQTSIEQACNAERFNMTNLYQAALPLFSSDSRISQLMIPMTAQLGSEKYLSFVSGAILRHVFLIELVKVPTIDSTKFRTRWFEQLNGDQRYCSFDECLEIAIDLISKLDQWLQTPEHRETLELFFKHPQLPYEAPIDYLVKPDISDKTTRIHRLGNVAWTYTETILRTLKLRKFLTQGETSPDAKFFKLVLSDKIKIKTYLTDRALTGNFKTNREKRWETHPHSVQFANRRTCMEIEYVLIEQLCTFDGFPATSRQALEKEKVLFNTQPVFQCPITLIPMSFEKFEAELTTRTHGKSSFQVGHLNPLKLDDPASATSGHTADNISWISDDGNRIQGSKSLDSIRKLLKQIADNYQKLKLH
ncbi:MAG: hypothetical protein V7L31_03535 [Nostoc sp.]|uniref:hypothetical protein n=1 Tax=Nostoc sp. TaxID=1180 RepID=UPI002FF2A340